MTEVNLGIAEAEDPSLLEEDLLAVLKVGVSLMLSYILAVLKPFISQSTVPSSTDVLVVDLSESQPICTWCRMSGDIAAYHRSVAIVDSRVVFWAPEVKVNEPAAFQLSLVAPTDITITSLPFISLAVYFSDNDYPFVIQHSPDAEGSSLIQKIDLGHVSSLEDDSREMEACLRWQPGGSIIITGTMSSDVPTLLKVGLPMSVGLIHSSR